MAVVRARIKELANCNLMIELGKGAGACALLFAKLHAKGDMRGARATLDQLLSLLGLSAQERHRSGVDHDSDIDR